VWLVLVLSSVVATNIGCVQRSARPAGLTDQEFWSLSEALSEPPGRFTLSDNFVSNEPRMVENVRWLRPVGGVYIGVGPEQNFSYIARLRPAMAFIIDIRSENRNLHLLYKALFELSFDRADFVSLLFSRARPPGLESSASVRDIFSSYARVSPSLAQYSRTAALVRERLLTRRGFPLSESDLEWIDRAFRAFYDDGPEIQFWGSRPVDRNAVKPTYRQLMTGRDVTGQSRSFLSTEDGFRFVKQLHSRNLIVPVIGDFGGPAAIQRVGDYVRKQDQRVQAFYGSNVGVYLNSEQTKTFCANLASLPAAPGAWFIESDGVLSLSSKLKNCRTDAR
jgi:hypothetical protein